MVKQALQVLAAKHINTICIQIVFFCFGKTLNLLDYIFKILTYMIFLVFMTL